MITNLGRVTPVPRGVYSQAENYRRLDIVTAGGSSYMAVYPDTFSNKPVTNTDYWMLLASGGAEDIIKTVYPVGIVLEFNITTSPNDLFPGTTWERFGNGRSTIGVDSSDPDFSTLDKTFGEKKHTMTVDELASHAHTAHARSGAGAFGAYGNVALPSKTGTETTVNTNNAGNSEPFNVVHPVITVMRWVRVK